MKELVIPPPATRDLNSIEMIRTWIAEQGLHCTINVGLYRDNGEHDEATAWGIILADVVRHLANAVEERYGDNQDSTIKAVVRSFPKALQLPTSAQKRKNVGEGKGRSVRL